MIPFDYTNKKVVGPAAYFKAFDAKVHRVNTLKTTGTSRSTHWKVRGEELEGGAYEAKFGDRWREEVKAALGRGSGALCNVTDIMDHVIAEANRLFKDTPFENCWVIYHDALSQWWSKGAQTYIEKTHPGFAKRQCRGLGHTNEGTRYLLDFLSLSPPPNYLHSSTMTEASHQSLSLLMRDQQTPGWVT